MRGIDDTRTLRNFVQLIDEDRTLLRQVRHHVAVVHNLFAHVNRSAKRLQRNLHNVDRPHHPGAKSAWLEQKNPLVFGLLAELSVLTGSRVEVVTLPSIPRREPTHLLIEPFVVQKECAGSSGGIPPARPAQRISFHRDRKKGYRAAAHPGCPHSQPKVVMSFWSSHCCEQNLLPSLAIQLHDLCAHFSVDMKYPPAFTPSDAHPPSEDVSLTRLSARLDAIHRLVSTRCCACFILVSVSFAPLSIRAISSIRSPSSILRTSVCVRPLRSVFAMRKC